MKPDDAEPGDAAGLRRQAEEALRALPARANGSLSHEEALALVHELQVHQIELELQNEELVRTRREAEALRDRYADLYDFAPVGYFTLDAAGVVREANLAGALQLGVERGSLIGAGFATLLDPDSRPGFAAFCARVLAGSTTETCDVSFAARPGRRAWCAQLRGRADAAGAAAFLRTVVTDITERRRAEEALRGSEETLRVALDRLAFAQRAAKTGFWDWDVPTGILTWSPEFYELFGLAPPAPASFETWLAVLHPDDRDAAMATITRSMEERTPLENEYRIVLPDGRERWIGAIGDTVYDAVGRPLRMAGICIDITDRKRAEAALREARDYLDSLIDHANAPIIVWDPAFRITRVNAAFEYLSGYAADDVIGRNLAVLFPEETREESLAKIQGSITEHWQSVEIPIRRPDGGVRIALWNSANIYDPSGTTLVATIAQGQDITERKKAEEALRQSEEQFRALFEHSQDAIVLSDPRRGAILAANPAACRMLGRAEEELVGRGPDVMVDPDHPRSVAMLLERSHGGSAHAELTYRRSDGSTFPGEVSTTLFSDGRGDVQSVAIIRDISERKRAEEALKDYAERLAASNEELQRFAYVASHDLQEPLRSIVSFSQLLERRYRGQLDRDADEYIDFIVEGGVRMQRLIQDLLTFSRIETMAGEPVPVDAGRAVMDSLATFNGQLRELGATMTVGPMPTVRADPRQLEQVFTNLIGNAIKYRRPEVPLEVAISAGTTDGMVEFSVRDNGIGIEAEYFDRIFEMFRRLHTHDKYEGTGIGLAVVKRIVERYGGWIRVESTPGQGSTFSFTLPAA